jgi:hypothetical protein
LEVAAATKSVESIPAFARNVERLPPAAGVPASTQAPSTQAPSTQAPSTHVQLPLSTQASTTAGTIRYSPLHVEPARIEAPKGRPGVPRFRGLTGRPPIEGGGEALHPRIKESLQQTFHVDLETVRVHTDGHARTVAETLGARAFAYANHIFLGPGESATDLGLLAHETAHVVQQQSAAEIQLSAPGQSDAFEVEADRAASAAMRGESFHVATRVNKPRVQRSVIGKLLDKLADWAYNIPGFRLLTLIIGRNPINWEPVERSAANILRGLVELIPGGHLIEEALDKYGVFEKAGHWIEQQLAKMAAIGSAIKADWDAFVDDLSWTDIRHPGKVWDDAVGVFERAVTRIANFAADVARDLLKLIKDAILMPLAKLAERTPFWDLLIAVLGNNPITGEAVERTPETLIGGFMKMIGQEEVWENIKKAHALERAWKWFQGALKGVLRFVTSIPSLVIDTLKSITLEDIIVLPRVFVKVGKAFLGFAKDFGAWALEQVLSLLQIIFEVVAPAVVPYLKKAAGAFHTIIKAPGRFVGNLVAAAKQGFNQFASKFVTYLKTAVIEWLTGTLTGASIYVPQSFAFLEIVKFVLSVLGLTWQNIRQKLVKVVGETAVKALEVGFDIVVMLVTKGPAAAWEKIQEGISNLKDMVIDGVIAFVKDSIVQIAITKLLSMLSPAGAFIQAIIATYNTIMFFVERLKQIARVAAAFIDSIAAIASGIIGAAANKVETTLGGLLTLVISFLARLIGLGNVGDAVKNIVNKVRDPIDKALDRVVDWIVGMAKKGGAFVAEKAAAIFGWETVKSTFKDPDGEGHTIYVDATSKTPRLMIASSPIAAEQFLTSYVTVKEKKNPKFREENAAKITSAETAIEAAKKQLDKIDAAMKDKPNDTAMAAMQRVLLDDNKAVCEALSHLVGKDREIGKLRDKYLLEGLAGTYGTMPKPTGDELTADHQPQAAILVEACDLGYFSKTGESRARQRAQAGYAINLHKLRHGLGRTYGGKGKQTKDQFLNELKKETKKTPAEKPRIVVDLIRKELDQDVKAMKEVIQKKEAWQDIDNLTDKERNPVPEKDKQELKQEITNRIIAGEDQMAAQDLDSLAQ